MIDRVCHLAGLRGLSWGGRAGWAPAAVALWSWRGARPRGRAGAALAFCLFPFALCLQILLASLRRHSLNPRRRLSPGRYRDRVIERIDIPGAHGAVPALHLVPGGGATGSVLVAHGSGCDKTFYAWRLADALVGRGLAVLLIDLDGHGESPRPQSDPQIVEAVAGPARWLRARYGFVGILGMSLGGAVAARAVAEGAPCDALALWEVPPRLRLSADEYRRVQLREARRLLRPQLLHLFRDGSPYHVIRAWQTSGIRATIGTWDLFDRLDLLGSLRRIGARGDRPPLLLWYAGRDAVVPAGSEREVRQAAAGWGEWRDVPGASHLSLPIELEVVGGTAGWMQSKGKREKANG